jgi:hypothetical protein
MKRLYYALNTEIAHYSDSPELRFVWADGVVDAKNLLKGFLDDETEASGIEWDINDFEIYPVLPENSGYVERDYE